MRETKTKRTPLPAGTVIEFCEMLAIVVEDTGDTRLIVDCEGDIQRWHWKFEGVECKVVALPETA